MKSKWLRRPADVNTYARPEEPIDDFGRVHLWIHDLDSDGGTIRQTSLSADEVVRAMKFSRPIDHDRFISRCVFVRNVLGRVEGIAAEDLEFAEGVCGKPLVGQPLSRHNGLARPLHFNLSHSENILGVAVAFGREVGLDLEVVDSSIEPGKFGPLLVTITDGSPHSPVDAPKTALEFYEAWTRKEALAKMRGEGIVPTVEPVAEYSTAVTRSFVFNTGGRDVVGSVAYES